MWERTQIFVGTEEIPLHIVTANESVHTNIWWSIPSSWIRITSARIEGLEQNYTPHKTLLATFVAVSSSPLSAGQITNVVCIPGKKFIKTNGKLSKIFRAKSPSHFLPQNTFPQTPNLISPTPSNTGIKFFFLITFLLTGICHDELHLVFRKT